MGQCAGSLLKQARTCVQLMLSGTRTIVKLAFTTRCVEVLSALSSSLISAAVHGVVLSLCTQSRMRPSNTGRLVLLGPVTGPLNLLQVLIVPLSVARAREPTMIFDALKSLLGIGSGA